MYLEGYRTVHQRIYLTPASRFKLHYTMEGLPAGDASEPPTVAPPIPPPPVGTFTPPRTLRPAPPPSPVPEAAAPAVAHGTLSLRVQPPDAAVSIDGERWESSDGEHFILQVPAGTHRIEVGKSGYRKYSTEIQVRDGETTPLNVSLTPERP